MSDLPHACRVLPDQGPPAIAITGDLHVFPILIADWQPDVLSEPFELAGNGTYRLRVTPMPPKEVVREWITCPNCGCVGSYLHIVLTDTAGSPLAGIVLSTAAHSMSAAIFSECGVMIQTVRRDDICFSEPVPARSFCRNFAAEVIEWA